MHAHTHTHTHTHSLTHHMHGLRVYSLGDDSTLVSDVVDQLIECCSLHLLVLKVAERVEVEVKDHAALTEFLDEQLLS